MMYEILDIVGHIPGFFNIKFNDDTWLPLDLQAEEDYYGDVVFDKKEDGDNLKNSIRKIRNGEVKKLLIHYQPACDKNGWKPALLTDELVDANKNVQESLNSIGVDFETENSQNGVWHYELFIPIELKLGDVLDKLDNLPENTLKSFKEFIKKYDIPSDGEVELFNIIRSIL